MTQVLDYSGIPPRAATVKAAGYAGAVRYLAWLPNPKVLTAGEAQDYWANGLSLGLVWEVAADPIGSDPSACGAEAARQAAALGFPTSVPIYVAFDYDAPQSDWASLAGWGDQFSRAAGHPWRGYCKKALGEQLAADGHFPSYWCPYAWSGNGQPGDHACLFQRLQTVTVDGTDCDVNDVLQADWGGWQPASQPPPAPVPPEPIGEAMTRYDLNITTDAQGNGYGDVAAPFGKVVAVFPNGADPATAHAYSPIPRLSANSEGTGTRVELEGAPANATVLVHVTVTD